MKFSKEDADVSLDDEINDLYEKDEVIKEFKVDLDLTTWFDEFYIASWFNVINYIATRFLDYHINSK